MSEQPQRRKPARQALDEGAPWRPVEFQPADAQAIQALVRGDCPAHLQQRAINFIVEKLCGTYDMPYRPGEDGRRDTDFACGMQWVGKQIVRLMKVRTNTSGEQP